MNKKIFLIIFIFFQTITGYALDDYYRILGVPRTATEDEIKQAYRRLARKYHPDVNNGSKTAEEILKKINEAKGVLTNSEKRTKYDSDFARQTRQSSAQQETKPRAQAQTQAKSQKPASQDYPFRRVNPDEAPIYRGTGGRSSWEGSGSARPRSSQTFDADKAKKFDGWQNFDEQPKPKAEARASTTRSEAPRTEAPRTEAAKTEAPRAEAPRTAQAPSVNPQSAPARTTNPNLKIYDIPRCNKEFLGTVLDILI